MATVIGSGKVKLNNGQTINASQGGWYDSQQFWGGTLSAPGVINSQSNQQGAGQAVSNEVVAQTNPANVAYIQQQQKNYQASAAAQPASTPSATSTPGAGVNFQAPVDNFDPVKFYETAYQNSGIRNTEADLTAKSNAHNEAVAKIKDNPYLSEATMTGRIKKLNDKFDADNLTAKNDIAMKKADVETQLNLQLKKLDINNAATKMAMDQFNTLLSSGALSGANGDDIANITRSTGISSSMIQASIAAQQKKDVKVSVSTFTADNGTVTAVAFDQNGTLVSKQDLGQIGNAQTGTGSATATKAQELQQTQANFIQDVKAGVTPRELVPRYGITGGLNIDEIYRLYNSYSPWGKAQETLEEFEEGKFVS